MKIANKSEELPRKLKERQNIELTPEILVVDKIEQDNQSEKNIDTEKPITRKLSTQKMENISSYMKKSQRSIASIDRKSSNQSKTTILNSQKYKQLTQNIEQNEVTMQVIEN